MLWPIVLPFQISLALWLAAIVVAARFGPRWNIKRLSAVMLSCVVGILLFIPSCVCIKYVLDPIRFGMFEYQDFAAVDDWRIERHLPESATEITLEKPAHGNGFRAKFNITPDDFKVWFDKSWAEGKAYSVFTREEAQEILDLPRFADLGWPEIHDAKQYVGPCENDGGGYTIWYSESQGIAYEQAGYW